MDDDSSTLRKATTNCCLNYSPISPASKPMTTVVLMSHTSF